LRSTQYLYSLGICGSFPGSEADRPFSPSADVRNI
jgi:hypothetical protein